MAKSIPLKRLRIDGGTQPRASIDDDLVKEYARDMGAGVEFPPVVVFLDGATHWLVDGFHRWHAAKLAGVKKLDCVVHQGTRAEARWHSYGANQGHGLRRTNADKRKAVLAALKHPNGDGKSHGLVAEHVGVSDNTVAKYARELKLTPKVSESTTRTGLDGRTTNTANIGPKPAKRTEPVEPDVEIIEPAEYYTLPDWEKFTENEKKGIISDKTQNAALFNKQAGDSIEWARWSWNPITGCNHGCEYCYARDIASRFFEQGFEPTFLPARLQAAKNTKVPKAAETDVGFRNVFTCSMADLFGDWVPREWIDAVLSVVVESPQWNFLFLTKNPQRLLDFVFPDNAWVGTTVDSQDKVAPAERVFREVKASVKWLSVEPMLKQIEFQSLDLFDWIVIGGASKSTRTAEFKPPRHWVNAIEKSAADAGCKIYEKANLLERIREYPMGGI